MFKILITLKKKDLEHFQPISQILFFMYFDELCSKKLLQPTHQKRAPKLVGLYVSSTVVIQFHLPKLVGLYISITYRFRNFI